jgi:hypothetical protein
VKAIVNANFKSGVIGLMDQPIAWVGYVHSNLAPKLHLSWLFKDVILIYLPVIAFLSLLSLIGINLEYSRKFYILMGLVMISGFSILVASLSSSLIRKKIFKNY